MLRFIALIILFLIAGCGHQSDFAAVSEPGKASYEGYDQSASMPMETDEEVPAASDEYFVNLNSDDLGGEIQENGKHAEVTERKVIYEADIRLVVKNFSETNRAVRKLIKKHSGFVANATINSNTGERQSGFWEAKVPVKSYDAFYLEVVELGFPESQNQTSQEVTEEFVDLQSRIKSKEQLEERILELLDNNEGKIKDIIDVERELARVRSEIEQMQGRLRYLKSRTDFTTVQIHAREEHDYVPPSTPEFLPRTQLAWSNSLKSLRTFGENLVVSTVSIAPWLISGAILFFPLVLLIRFRRKRRKSKEKKRE